MKSNLFDRPRYKFDEEQLFSHSHNKALETKTFPWYKPVWDEEFNEWKLVNPEGKALTLDWVTDTMPDHTKNLEAARKYALTSTFFVEWCKKVAYYQGVFNWHKAYAAAKYDNPKKKDEQLSKMADAEVAAFFESLK